MAKRTKELGLGRGLNALLGDPDLQAQGEGSVSLPISQVQPGLNQPRKRFDQDALADLAESIRVHGIIQPLTVRRLSSGYYQIIAGERRWRAAKLAGLAEVPAVIIEADDRKVMELGVPFFAHRAVYLHAPLCQHGFGLAAGALGSLGQIFIQTHKRFSFVDDALSVT